MTMTRRTLLKGAAVSTVGVALAARLVAAEDAKATPRIRVSSCSIGSLQNAKAAGLDGMEVGAGGAAEKLSISDPKTIEKYKDQMKETGLAVSSIMMGLFNSEPLASDPRGPAWLEQAIDGGKQLGVNTILIAFFGKGSLKEGRDKLKKADIDVVVQRIKAAAPKAQDAGLYLGIENTISAKDNMEILDRINSPAVRIYYDIYNLAGEGYDTPAEIRMLKDRISIFHFKNGGDYLETGKVKWEPVVAAIKEIGYKGWIVLESSAPSKDRVADDKKNAEYVRKLFA